VDDSVKAIKEAIVTRINIDAAEKQRGIVPRTREIAAQTQKIQDHATPDLRADAAMTHSSGPSGRGRRWYNSLTNSAVENAEGESVFVGDAQWGTETIRAIGVGPNPLARFPRARQGQMGVEEGWGIARAIWEAIDSDNKWESTSPWLLPWMRTSLPENLIIQSWLS
jgi:hypothetical protein